MKNFWFYIDLFVNKFLLKVFIKFVSMLQEVRILIKPNIWSFKHLKNIFRLFAVFKHQKSQYP